MTNSVGVWPKMGGNFVHRKADELNRKESKPIQGGAKRFRKQKKERGGRLA